MEERIRQSVLTNHVELSPSPSLGRELRRGEAEHGEKMQRVALRHPDGVLGQVQQGRDVHAHPCIMQISEITTLGLLQDLHEKLHGEVLAGAGILHLQAEGEDLGVAAHLRQTVQLTFPQLVGQELPWLSWRSPLHCWTFPRL